MELASRSCRVQVLVTLYTLFGEDLRRALTSRTADPYWDGATLACLTFLAAEAREETPGCTAIPSA